MKIGILYICTGEYSVFWEDFHTSCEEFFIPSAEKQYFVFTDAESIKFENKKNVNRIYQEKLDWPYSTMMRYDMFSSITNLLEELDYVVFFNANSLFVKKIEKENFLPLKPDMKYIASQHPGFYNKSREEYTYENNKSSKAFIDASEGEEYYAGGINGGESKAFIEAAQVMNANIKEDLENNITAKWHDESHWNKFLLEKGEETKVLSPAYLYPEEDNLPFEKKIILRDKNNYGGHDKMRGTVSFYHLAHKMLSKIKDKIASWL